MNWAYCCQTLFTMRNIKMEDVNGVAIASVVPPLDASLRRVCELCFKVRPLFVEPGVKTGLPVLTDNPGEVGADRVVNCVAAFDMVGGPAIVVDMGTATTFDVISKQGAFLGGAIARDSASRLTHCLHALRDSLASRSRSPQRLLARARPTTFRSASTMATSA